MASRSRSSAQFATDHHHKPRDQRSTRRTRNIIASERQLLALCIGGLNDRDWGAKRLLHSPRLSFWSLAIDDPLPAFGIGVGHHLLTSAPHVFSNRAGGHSLRYGPTRGKGPCDNPRQNCLQHHSGNGKCDTVAEQLAILLGSRSCPRKRRIYAASSSIHPASSLL